jgi:hypothetical protein
MIDAFSLYKGIEEKERFHKDPMDKRIVNKDLLYDFVLLMPHFIHDWLYERLYKGNIIVRKYEITPGDIPKMHQCFRVIKNSIFSIQTKGGVYLEEYCNTRVIYDKFSDFFETADHDHLLQILHHFKIENKTHLGRLTFITIRPEEFEKLGFLYRTMDDFATELSHIYFKLGDTGKEDPKARVRIIKHHNRDEETKKGEYYDICERHGWLYLEGCEYEEKEQSIREILNGISHNGRSKLEEEINDIIESEKKLRTRKEEESIGEHTENIKKILSEEGLSDALAEILLRGIMKEPDEILHELAEFEEELPAEMPQEYPKEHEGQGGEILDVAFWVTLAAGTYILIEEFIPFFGL